MTETIRRCPETRAHYAHEFYTPIRNHCPGGPDERGRQGNPAAKCVLTMTAVEDDLEPDEVQPDPPYTCKCCQPPSATSVSSVQPMTDPYGKNFGRDGSNPE